MRKDMAKILVERPRYGDKRWREVRSRFDQTDPEEMPLKLGMKRPHRYKKELNENLNPLIRFLYAHVGQNWNDVYSEICQRVNARSAVQYHILQHLFQFVETKVQIIDGEPWDASGRYKIESWGSWYGMYVDPRDGCLKLTPKHNTKRKRREQRNKRKTPLNVVVSDNDLIEYHLINGIWYEVVFEYRELPTMCRSWERLGGRQVYDLIYKTYMRECDLRHHYGNRMPIKKLQLNGRRIKQLGLWETYACRNKQVA